MRYKKRPMYVEAFEIKDETVEIRAGQNESYLAERGDMLVVTETGNLITLPRDKFHRIYEPVETNLDLDQREEIAQAQAQPEPENRDLFDELRNGEPGSTIVVE